MDYKILTWNCRQLFNKREELIKHSLSYNIIACTETWLKPDINFSIPGFALIRKDRPHKKGGGLLLAVHKHSLWKHLPEIDLQEHNAESLTIQVHIDSEPLTIAICYRTPNSPIDLDKWNKYLSDLNSKGNFILLGDFNAHHIYWNCPRTDSTGEHLLSALEENNCIIINNSTLSYLGSNWHQSSNLDLAIAPCLFAHRFQSEQIDDTWGSDHHPILITLQITKRIYRKPSSRLSSKKTNWQHYTLLLNSLHSTDSFYTLNAIDQYDTITSTMREAVSSVTPSKKDVPSSRHRNPVPWWDLECDRAIRCRKALLKKWKHTGHSGDWVAYQKQAALTKKLIKSKKRINFKLMASQLNKNSDLRLFWHRINILKNRWLHSQPNSSAPLDYNTYIETINKLCPVWAPTESLHLDSTHFNPVLDDPFSIEELNRVLHKLKPESAPGPDMIENKMILHLPDSWKKLLLDCINLCYTSLVFPEEWSECTIKLIPKSNKQEFRPIALTSNMCKIVERLVSQRLYPWLEQQQLFPLAQTGFRKGRSTLDNIAGVILLAKTDIKKKRTPAVVFLDIKAAFDNVIPEILLDKLKRFQVSRNPLAFIQALSACRRAHFLIPDESGNRHLISRLQHKGVPQGGVLSPLLYSLYVSDIAKNISSSISVFQYADDIAIYAANGSLNSTVSNLEAAVTTISTNLRHLGLEVSPNKSKLVILNGKLNPPGVFSLWIGHHCITNQESANFLGIQIDQKLKFHQHALDIHTRTRKILNLIKVLRGTWWGADPSTLLLIYKSLIRSRIDYGLHIYLPLSKFHMQKLESIQIVAARLALGHRKTTPINVTLAEAKLPPLNLRAKYLASKHLIEASSAANHFLPSIIQNYQKTIATTPKRLLRSRSTLLEDIAIQSANHLSVIAPSTAGSPFLASSAVLDTYMGQILKTSSNINRDFNSLISSEFPNQVMIFTDGSKIPHKPSVGASWLCPAHNLAETVSLNNLISNYSAEAIAIDKALESLITLPDKSFIICSDALSVLKAVTDPYHKTNNHYIYSIKKKINLLTDPLGLNKEITLLWIPAHKGLEGNELADQLSKDATNLPPHPFWKIPSSDFKKHYLEEMWDYTFKFWTHKASLQAATGKKYFSTHFSDQKKPWFNQSKLPRIYISWVNRARSNHYSLNGSLARVKLTQHANCPCGADVQDINHILWQCHLYESLRSIMINRLIKNGWQLPLSIDSILASPNDKDILIISSFLRHHYITI